MFLSLISHLNTHQPAGWQASQYARLNSCISGIFALNSPIVYSLKEIADSIGAEQSSFQQNAVIKSLATDSRRIVFPHNSLFFALKANADGHNYIKHAYKSGIRNFVISQKNFPVKQFEGADFLLVENTLVALQKLAAFHRKQFDYPLVAIGGSNGKTIVKEWLFQLLSVDKNVVRSPKSYNSQVGVPLSLWQMNADHNLALIEAGISQAGEMALLEEMIKPTIGLLTNIGQAHDEGFDSREQKVTEKLKLFKDVDIFIWQKDTLLPYANPIPGKRKFCWSFTQQADLKITDLSKNESSTKISALLNEKEIVVEIPFTDEVSIHNAITCWCVMLALDYSDEDIKFRMQALAPVSMRMELKKAINNCSLINDSYNSDLESLESALEFLRNQHQHSKKTLILSNILQTGVPAKELYKKVAEMLRSKKVDSMIGIGPELVQQKNAFSTAEKRFYASTDEFIKQFEPNQFNNEAILVKGARVFQFERIDKLLEQKVHETVFEINLNAIVNNLNVYKSLLQPKTAVMAMVKAFSYGSGSYEIASLLQYHKVDYLAVAYVDEGTDLRKNGIICPIMVMSPEVSSFEALLESNLEPELYNFRILTEWCSFLKNKDITGYPVHIKLDTGMHRLGFEENDLPLLIDFLKKHGEIRVKSVFSHLAASDEPQWDSFSRQQTAIYNQMADKLQGSLGYDFIKHICNSAATLRFPEAHFDMVRLGIGLYGIDQGGETKRFQAVGTLKTTITQLKKLTLHETVGYGRMGKIKKTSKIATVKIGYADGLNRHLGNGVGHMLVNGKKAPIIGNICMDMCMLDVTDVDCIETDEVIVFNEELTIEALAQKLNTSPYEILCNVSQRVKRIYTYE